MLSYQHAYHAGNAADVHKHAVLAACLDYLVRKPKPLSYLETHAGRGLYDLAGAEARKTGEAATGVARLEHGLPEDHPYRRALAACRAAHGASAYPGSPWIARHLLRADDRLTLAERHPQEHAALARALAAPNVTVTREDGRQMALSRTPPEPRRGLMLIDPSWEEKADYTALPALLRQIAKRWNVGVVILWYPVLTDARHAPMLATLARDHPGALRHEVRFPPAREGHGMVGSGLFILNPPFGLGAEAATVGALFEA